MDTLNSESRIAPATEPAFPIPRGTNPLDLPSEYDLFRAEGPL